MPAAAPPLGFGRFLDEIDDAIRQRSEPDVAAHLIVDNYGTHKAPKVKKWFLRHPRYHVHVTPTSASWFHMAERFLSSRTTRRIRRGAFSSVESLKKPTVHYGD